MTAATHREQQSSVDVAGGGWIEVHQNPINEKFYLHFGSFALEVRMDQDAVERLITALADASIEGCQRKQARAFASYEPVDVTA